MYDEQRIYSLLERIEDAILLIQNQTDSIETADYFLNSQEGIFMLGGVCMQLIFIGESVKTLDAKNAGYLADYPEIPWREVMGLRNVIAHEYHHIDAEEILNVIKKDLPVLLSVIQRMKNEI
ncbi:DUF86 domain-containing protein [Bacteroides sp. L10-4]|jgi:uncharacterized protein with HEPN domain|uniref:DUF86 domain-containing protein n=1 Tax=Bacteroides muris (ex Fokt et al. 2023) TaxID=2937417 RepID=A0A9X2NTI5_9BACE|nr:MULTISPECIES: HepT-like ribonuclease domain-containing protein [Bacteroides]MCR6505609.1 DUF86 domain-containing protein [Bacteroides muris (ex Fokt et al. 2023)]NVK95046.1 DUF86 domain-containing protein [Bacteroides sp. L10-4]